MSPPAACSRLTLPQAAHDIGTITIETIMSHLNGQSVDADILVAPKMITPENADPNA